MRIEDILSNDASRIEAAFLKDKACINKHVDSLSGFPLEELASTLCLIKLGAKPLSGSGPEAHFLDVSFSKGRYPLLVAMLLFSPHGHEVYDHFMHLESTSDQKSFFVRMCPERAISKSFIELMQILPDYYNGTDIEKLRVITATFMILRGVRETLELEVGCGAETNFNRVIKLIGDLKKDYDRRVHPEFLKALKLRVGSFVPEDLNADEGKLFQKLVRKLDYSMPALNLAGETMKNKSGSIASYLDDYRAYQATMEKQASTSQEASQSNAVLFIVSELLARSRAALPPESIEPPDYDPRMFARVGEIRQGSVGACGMTLGKKND